MEYWGTATDSGRYLQSGEMPEYNKGKSYCCVPKCKNNSKTMPRRYFFALPKDKKRRRLWLKQIRRKHALNSKSITYVCSDHFDMETDVINYLEYSLSERRPRLKKEAVPTNFECQGRKNPPANELRLRHHRTCKKDVESTNIIEKEGASSTQQSVANEVELIEDKKPIFDCLKNLSGINDSPLAAENHLHDNLQPTGDSLKLEHQSCQTQSCQYTQSNSDSSEVGMHADMDKSFEIEFENTDIVIKDEPLDLLDGCDDNNEPTLNFESVNIASRPVFQDIPSHPRCESEDLDPLCDPLAADNALNQNRDTADKAEQNQEVYDTFYDPYRVKVEPLPEINDAFLQCSETLSSHPSLDSPAFEHLTVASQIKSEIIDEDINSKLNCDQASETYPLPIAVESENSWLANESIESSIKIASIESLCSSASVQRNWEALLKNTAAQETCPGNVSDGTNSWIVLKEDSSKQLGLGGEPIKLENFISIGNDGNKNFIDQHRDTISTQHYQKNFSVAQKAKDQPDQLETQPPVLRSPSKYSSITSPALIRIHDKTLNKYLILIKTSETDITGQTIGEKIKQSLSKTINIPAKPIINGPAKPGVVMASPAKPIINDPAKPDVAMAGPAKPIINGPAKPDVAMAGPAKSIAHNSRKQVLTHRLGVNKSTKGYASIQPGNKKSEEPQKSAQAMAEKDVEQQPNKKELKDESELGSPEDPHKTEWRPNNSSIPSRILPSRRCKEEIGGYTDDSTAEQNREGMEMDSNVYKRKYNEEDDTSNEIAEASQSEEESPKTAENCRKSRKQIIDTTKTFWQDDDFYISCKGCKRMFLEESHYNEHCQSFQGQRVHKCFVCNELCYSLCDVQSHCVFHASVDSTNYCVLQDSDFMANKSILIQYIQLFNTVRFGYFACVCGQMFNMQISLIDHIEKKYNICKLLAKRTRKLSMRKFNKRSKWRGKVLEKLPELPPLPPSLPKCSVCDLEFYNRYDYLEHIRFAHIMVYTCDLCYYQSNNKSNLLQHIKSHLRNT